jgi:hypothetical protein
VSTADGSRPVSPNRRRCSWVKPTPRFRLGETIAGGIRGTRASLITTSVADFGFQITVTLIAVNAP